MEDDEADDVEDDGGDEEVDGMPLRESVLRELLAPPSGAKLTPDAMALSSVLVRAFVMEGWSRAAAEAERCCADAVDESHLERILPQLLIDFA